jgi:hypothetical protein
MVFLDYENFLNEAYYSKNHNIRKVMNSTEPVTGAPIFQENETQSIYAVRRKLQDSLADYEKHVADATVKDREWRADAIGQKGEKGNIQWYDAASKARNLALKIVKESATFMEKFNNLYDSLKGDLLGTDHIKVAKAIYTLQGIYPHSLINEAGKLKRLKRMKIDSKFILDVIKWTDSIMQIYNSFDEAGKLLGKSEKQIEGARKQSLSQKMRWGMY